MSGVSPTAIEAAELLRHQHTPRIWSEPERRGLPPLHETNPSVAKMLNQGWITRLEGGGYAVTPLGVQAARLASVRIT